MILNVSSDASYMSEPKSRSRAGGHFFFPHQNKTSTSQGPIHIESTILKHVVPYAEEAEIASLFFNAHTIVTIQQILHKLNHPQPPTPLQTDNKTAHGIICQQ